MQAVVPVPTNVLTTSALADRKAARYSLIRYGIENVAEMCWGATMDGECLTRKRYPVTQA
jgi:hypothetical protein